MIAIIKYNGGNVSSVQNSLNRLNVESVVTDDFDLIRKADKVIFPGVGEASSTMKLLKEKGLDQLIPTLKQPVLGVCLGMQLMCKKNEEGNTVGMGIFDIDVKSFLQRILFRTWDGIRFQILNPEYFQALKKTVMCILFTVSIANYRKIQRQFAITFCRSVLLCKKIIFMPCSFTLKNPEM